MSRTVDYELEAVSIEDTTGDMEYEKVPSDVSDDSGSSSDDDDDDQAVLRMVKARRASSQRLNELAAAANNNNNNNNNSRSSSRQQQTSLPRSASTVSAAGAAAAARTATGTIPPVIDDFIRNFLVKHKLMKTLDMFQTEWYECEVAGKPISTEKVPDIYGRIQELEEELNQMRQMLKQKDDIALKAKSTWDRFRKQRDFHRMHHRRVIQEKNKLITDLKRLRNHYAKYEPTIQQLRKRYEDAVKEKMLLTLENDRLKTRIEAMDGDDAPVLRHRQRIDQDGRLSYERDTHASREARRSSSNNNNNKTTASTAANVVVDSVIPVDYRENPFCNRDVPVVAVEKFRPMRSFVAHDQAVAALALHPTKLVVATGADDRKWKLWSLQGDLIMTGDGHRDWIGGCAFHPGGTRLATASGDTTVKVWDLATARCAHTFTDHTQAAWDVCFHECGDFLVSASLDHTARVWDLGSQRCRQVLRGHVDSVNKVCFQPSTNNICTGSADKTISIWDMRSGLCVQTFYGHNNAVSGVDFSARGDRIVSTDLDGVVKVWDVRVMSETAHIVTNRTRHAANQAIFDRSGERVTVALDDGSLQVYDVNGRSLSSFNAHPDGASALNVCFDPSGQFLVSVGNDGKCAVFQ